MAMLGNSRTKLRNSFELAKKTAEKMRLSTDTLTFADFTPNVLQCRQGVPSVLVHYLLDRCSIDVQSRIEHLLDKYWTSIEHEWVLQTALSLEQTDLLASQFS